MMRQEHWAFPIHHTLQKKLDSTRSLILERVNSQNSLRNLISSLAFSNSRNSFFVNEGIPLGFFFLKMTRLSASRSFDREEKSFLVLSPIPVSISSLPFFDIMSKGVLLVSDASNPKSMYFFEKSELYLLFISLLLEKIFISLKTWCPKMP